MSTTNERIVLSLALHNHQPVGNFDFVFRQGYEVAYEPMVAALERHPKVRVALHYTGPLREWLLKNRPELLERIRVLVGREQVEIMSGGYYEPILIALPDTDKQGQIRKLNLAVQEDYDFVPVGAWLAERIWEPHLARDLAASGIRYTIVDDTHFTAAGLSEDKLFGYYVTEEQGRTLKIFATSRSLRYMIPWEEPERVLEWLRGQASASEVRVAVMGDDGEKFGMWPGTYEHCWGAGSWVERFFTLLEDNERWIETIPPGECADRFSSLGRVYLPTASYDEMMEWALPAALSGSIGKVKNRLQQEGRSETLRFIRGGFWRNFMVKYPEVNTMHKKMLRVSEKIERLSGELGLGERSLDQARDHLWAGQCNCPYWHGVFGGIYLFHIRAAAFEHLIKAENLADSLKHEGRPWVDWTSTDFDRDGRPELLLESDQQNLYFDPDEGGHCFEWDWRPGALNLLNTLSRYREGYHDALREAAERGEVVISGQEQGLETIHASIVRAKSPGLHEKLVYDTYRRASFIDHVFADEVTLPEFSTVRYREAGDLVSGRYDREIGKLDTGGRSGIELKLSREGKVAVGDTGPSRLDVEKTFKLYAGNPELEVGYNLVNASDRNLRFTFAVETNWALLGGSGPDVQLILGRDAAGIPAAEPAEPAAVRQARIELARPKMSIEMQWSKAADLWWFPVETVSNSEAGFESIYQGSCLVARWPLRLAPGEQWRVVLKVCPGSR